MSSPAKSARAWEDGLVPTDFPCLHGEVVADVCVIGLGGSGLSCIQELLRLGARVVGIDAASIAGGAAGSNGGFLLAGAAAFHHDAVALLGRERAGAIYALTTEQIDLVASETPGAVRRCGSLRIAASEAEEEDCILQLEALTADGFEASAYTGTEGTGLLFPRDASFNPLERCRVLARRVASGGAVLFENTPAIEIFQGDVRTPAGRIRCTHVIVAIDGKLEHVLPELTGRVRTARLQMLSTEPVHDIRLPRPVYSRWGYDYWQQLADGRIVLGGCRDRFADAEWTNNTVPTDEVQTCMERILRETLGVTARVDRRWGASVSYSDGVLPVIEQVRPGVWAIGGYSGTGNVIGAIYGRMVAQVAVTGKSALAATFAPSLAT